MTASIVPNWMIIAGLLYSTVGAFLIGKAILLNGALNLGGESRGANRSQQRLDVLSGLSFFGVGSGLQIFAQLGGGAPSGAIVVLLLALIGALMLYALCDDLAGEPVRKQPAVKKDVPQRASPLPVLIATSVPDSKIAAKA